ncbi:MAG: dUTP diphosphatase [Bacilli bacterium]|nr:dUTP diphosphatase [Bacilli bacterium]
MRGFEIVSVAELKKYKLDSKSVKTPKRGTKNSAGYDFYIPLDISLKPNSKVIIPTGIKAYMESDEVLLLVIRSSLGIKYGIRLLNQVGVIDSDYYNNPENEGHILIGVENTSNEEISFKTGDRLAQGIFMKYLISDQEKEPKVSRLGGIGSTF